MLLNNYNVFNQNPGRAIGGPTDPIKWYKGGSVMQFYFGQNTSAELYKNSFNNGFYPPYSWILAPKAGGLSSFKNIDGAGQLTNGNLAGGLNGVSTINGTGNITDAACGLILSAVATIAGSGTFSADIVGKLDAAATLAGSGSMTAALGALADAVCTIIGTGSLSSDITAKGWMSADVTPYTALSPESLAASVWNALAASYNSTGSMGEKLNSAGTAGDPWTADLSGYNTPGTAGKKLKDQKNPSLLIDGEVIV